LTTAAANALRRNTAEQMRSSADAVTNFDAIPEFRVS